MSSDSKVIFRFDSSETFPKAGSLANVPAAIYDRTRYTAIVFDGEDGGEVRSILVSFTGGNRKFPIFPTYGVSQMAFCHFVYPQQIDPEAVVEFRFTTFGKEKFANRSVVITSTGEKLRSFSDLFVDISSPDDNSYIDAIGFQLSLSIPTLLHDIAFSVGGAFVTPFNRPVPKFIP